MAGGDGTVGGRVWLRLWLAALALMVLAMVVVGGATRLTHSGLSITEWQPILGVVPPLSEADWQAAFAKYRQIPEYQVLNKGMSLAEFQALYWWEWSHRLLGRLVGVVFLVPFLVFWWRGWLDGRLWRRLAVLFGLGGLQGAAGWYMVASGLSERTDVSQYRLALHLGLAVLILGALIWQGLALAERPAAPGWQRTIRGRLALALLAALYLQVLLGAFVAGLDAGLSHNTWPLMDGQLVPDGLLIMSPWWVNAFENVLTVQFNHRVMAYVVALLAATGVVAQRLGRRPATPLARLSADGLALAVLGQIGLGIWTLLWAVPLWLGLAHQAIAMLVLGLAVLHLWAVRTAA